MTAKTLFLGVEGGDHAFMDAMMAEGELPAFARLKASSRVFELENDPAMGAANFWNSASIGAGPGHHGHYFYMQFKPDTYHVLSNHESSIPDIKPFWNILDEDGYSVGVIDWHRLQAKPMKHGLLIDNWMAHDPLTETVYFPAALEKEARRYFQGDIADGGFACRKRQTLEEMEAYLHALMKRIDAKTAFCVDKLKEKEWDLFAPCFSEIHDVGHYFYHLDDPNHERYDPAIAAKLREPLRQCYRQLDKAAGAIINAAGDGARKFAYGGPGMEMYVSANGAFDEIIRRIDLGVGAKLSAAEAARQTYRSFIPQNLRWKLAPLARAVRRRIADHDYARRRFFAVPNNENAGAVRINVKGREKHGIVEPGAAYEAVVQEITDAVATFKNPDTGRPLVKRVVRVRKEFPGPHQEVLPDLFIEWERAGAIRNFRKVVSDKYGEVEIADVLRTGDHNPSGFYWAPRDYAGAPVTRPADITASVMETVRTARVETPSPALAGKLDATLT